MQSILSSRSELKGLALRRKWRCMSHSFITSRAILGSGMERLAELSLNMLALFTACGMSCCAMRVVIIGLKSEETFAPVSIN
jgi:hypothetical protein